MTSIRRRTTLVILCLLVVGLTILAAFNLHDSRLEISEIYDAKLAQNARLLEGIVGMSTRPQEQEQLYTAFNLALSKAAPDDANAYESMIAFQVWDRKDRVLVRSIRAPELGHFPSLGFGDLTDGDGRRWRTFVLNDNTGDLRIWIGEREDVRADLVSRIVRHTLWPTLMGSLLLIAVIWVAIGWGLKPLSDLAIRLRARHSGSLEPLRMSPLPSELEPVQAAINSLLDQIKRVLGRERRFIADAAHEMRTPLAILRIHAQNLLDARSFDERSLSLNHLIGGVDRTSRLVNQLLTMARLEPSETEVLLVPTDLAVTIRDCLVNLTPWVLSKGVDLSFEAADGPCVAMTHQDFVNIALNNLISNAVNFSPNGGAITVRLVSDIESVWVSVEDQGPGIDEANLERVFERFYSRGNDQGAGLGLAIVQTIALRLNGLLTLDNLAPTGLKATLCLPTIHAPSSSHQSTSFPIGEN